MSFDINNDLFGENAHKSTSIHPQTSVRNLVNSLGEDATIFVRNENRFNEIAGLLSDNPPTLLATIKSVEAMVTHDNIKSQAEISDKKLSIRQDTEYLSVAEKYRDGTATEAEIEQLRKMVDEAAKKAGYTSDTDWRMDHKAPNAKYDVPIYQVDTLYGGDGSIYSNRAAYYYGDGRSYDQKAIRVLQKVRNNPNADITVYRAVPTNRVESHVRNGDWVTTVEEYAKEHGDRVLDGEYRIIKNTVPAKYVYANGDSIHEYGYDDGKDYGYRNTENNRKLLDLVTYDDNGNIIPLSERFNPEKSDTRWSARQEESYSTKSILTQLNADTVSQLDADGKKLLQSYQRMAKRADYYRNQIDQLRAEKNAWKGKSIHAGSVLNSTLASKNAEINELQRKLENTEKIMAGQVRNPQIARLVNTARDQAVKQLRAEKNAKIAQIRQEKNAQIDRVRTQYQTSIANAREGRAVTELRGKIRKVAEDIKGRMTAPSDARYIPLGLAQSVIDLSGYSGLCTCGRYEGKSEI